MGSLDWLLDAARRSAHDSIVSKMLEVGADLVSEDGENPEYDRAIYELIAHMPGDSLGTSDMDERRKRVEHTIALMRIGRDNQ